MPFSDDISIYPLTEKPELADICAAWSFGEWVSQTKASDLDKTRARYRLSAKSMDSLPVTWVALYKDYPAGMISLKQNDHPDIDDLSPWLASLFVHPGHRGKGIARSLIARLEKESKETYGATTIYLFTSGAAKMYEAEGFEKIRNIRDPSGLNPAGDVLMKKDLS